MTLTTIISSLDTISLCIGVVLGVLGLTLGYYIGYFLTKLFRKKKKGPEGNLIKRIEKWDAYMREMHGDFNNLYSFLLEELSKKGSGTNG